MTTVSVGDVSVLLVGMNVKTSKRLFEAVCLSVSKQVPLESEGKKH